MYSLSKGRQRRITSSDIHDGDDFSNITHKNPHLSAKRLPGSPSDRIYIVGIGNVGNLIAHSLRTLPKPPPVTLIMHTPLEKRRWDSSTKEITVIKEGASASESGFDVEVMRQGSLFDRQFAVKDINPGQGSDPQPGDDRIDNLIVCVNAPHVRAALFRLSHRLHRRSAILILSSGMGIVEDVNELVFPKEDARPDYLIGVLTHGIVSESFNAVNLAKIGSISIGLVPRQRVQNNQWSWRQSANARYLLRQVTRVPTLQAVGLHPTKVLLLQIERLVIDAVINTLPALLDARTGALLFNSWIHRVACLLIQEMSVVIRSLPELQNVSDLDLRFSSGRLEKLVFAHAHNAANNFSLMLRHVQNGHLSEIEHLNGYLMRRGEELGIACPNNYMIVQLIRGKTQIMREVLGHSLRFEASGEGS